VEYPESRAVIAEIGRPDNSSTWVFREVGGEQRHYRRVGDRVCGSFTVSSARLADDHAGPNRDLAQPRASARCWLTRGSYGDSMGLAQIHA